MRKEILLPISCHTNPFQSKHGLGDVAYTPKMKFQLEGIISLTENGSFSEDRRAK
jgi:hypothetical protein